jgi:CubicO group peptidase (beta-lactamase class C family)
MNRREFLGASAGAAISASGRFYKVEAFADEPGGKYKSTHKALDRFVEEYLRAMNAPGLTMAMADRDGVQRLVTYGFSDVELQARIRPDALFQIGSISKSFLAICLLQLRQEGKLDFQKPITEYLPWFRIESSFEPITTHHMLTHTSGLPGIPNVFLSDPAAKHRAAYGPGKLFHYNNMAFATLGLLLMSLEGRTLTEIYRQRIFEPLGMANSEPVITLDQRERTAKNYSSFQNDRPFPRFGRLCEAPAIVFTDAAGCIASTPHDMALYVQMLARHGEGRKGRLLSEESFGLFSQAYIKAEEFGPTASYGYGIATDTLDGDKVVRHTGGMISFASAMWVDIEEGVGAFASINAMQGYRPNPVAQYAVQLMRAQRSGKGAPSAPVVRAATETEHAADYAGTFQSSDGGKSLVFVAEGKQLFLEHQGRRVALESQGDGAFIVLHPDFSRFAMVFGRADAKDAKSPVVEVGWGSEWYTGKGYTGAKSFEHPKDWDAYVGHYRNENNWIGSLHITMRKGVLLADGAEPLQTAKDGTFRMGGDEADTEWIQFHDVVDGRAMRIKLSGEDLWRVLAP